MERPVVERPVAPPARERDGPISPRARLEAARAPGGRPAEDGPRAPAPQVGADLLDVQQLMDDAAAAAKPAPRPEESSLNIQKLMDDAAAAAKPATRPKEDPLDVQQLMNDAAAAAKPATRPKEDPLDVQQLRNDAAAVKPTQRKEEEPLATAAAVGAAGLANALQILVISMYAVMFQYIESF